MQKEEELARLQEENNHLRQFLNSALIQQLEEKTKVMNGLQEVSGPPRQDAGAVSRSSAPSCEEKRCKYENTLKAEECLSLEL